MSETIDFQKGLHSPYKAIARGQLQDDMMKPDEILNIIICDKQYASITRLPIERTRVLPSFNHLMNRPSHNSLPLSANSQPICLELLESLLAWQRLSERSPRETTTAALAGCWNISKRQVETYAKDAASNLNHHESSRCKNIMRPSNI